MDVCITPQRLSGTITAPSSKSHAHRLIVAAALSDKPTAIKINCVSNDIRATLSAIKVLGADYLITDNEITVTPIKNKVTNVNINCFESGTTARFILPVACAFTDRFTLSGEGSLINRPFKEICDSLKNNGCTLSGDSLPITVNSALCGGRFYLSGKVSSQYVSGLLFALPLLYEDSEIIITGRLQSSGYVDMTISVLKLFGINVLKTDFGFKIKGNQHYISPGNLSVEGDWSNASYWLAAGVKVTGLDNNSLQKDKIITEIIDNIDVLKEIDLSQIPDLAPVIAVIFALNSGVRRMVNAQRLRFKESDRIESTVAMINSLGGKAYAEDDSIVVEGGALSGGRVSSFNDHRIVMAAVIAASHAMGETVIENADAVNKSYPEFFSDFIKLGGRADVI